MWDRLTRGGWTLEEAAPIDPAQLTAVHPAEYLESLAATESKARTVFDADTYACPGTWQALLGSVGAVVEAGKVAASAGKALAVIRPPGHHALRARPMGFCFLANAIVLAKLLQGLGKERLLIVDWDVHHGNGTQSLVEHDLGIRFVSMHQWPGWPGTGRADERGVGNLFNVPMAPGLPRATYLSALWGAIVQATEGWQPETVVVSAGFDCLAGDPLGGFTLEPEDLATVSLRLQERCPEAGIAAVLEGGYVPTRLADGVEAVLGAFGG